MPYLTTKTNDRLFYRDLGRGEALILLHGFGMQSSHWLPFAVPLSLRNRIIIPDLRGFGKSHHADFSQDCILSNFADDLHELIEYLNLKHFRLAGISMGALTALQYQGQYQDLRIERYLHIDQSPACINQDDWQWGLFGKDQTLRFKRATKLLEQLSPYEASRTPYAQIPESLKQALWNELADFFATALSAPGHKRFAKLLCRAPMARDWILPTHNWWAYVRCMRAYLERNYDLRKTLSDVDIPTTVLVGMRSEMYPVGGQLRIADYRKNCEILPFNRSGHAPLIDQPIEFLKHLRHFATRT